MPRQNDTAPKSHCCESASLISVRGAMHEMFGTLGVVFIVCGAAASNYSPGAGASYFHVVAAAYGLGTAAMTYATSHVKSGQLNPAITFALHICGYLSFGQFIVNVFFQCVGAVVGCFLLQGMFHTGLDDLSTAVDKTGNLGATFFSGTGRVGEGHAFLTEACGTFIVCFVAICCACNKKNLSAIYGTPLAMGFTIYALVLTIYPVTGASFNPARSTAPSLVTNKYVEQLWVYWLGPLTGALFAGVFGRFMWITPEDVEVEDAKATTDLGDVELAMGADAGEVADQVARLDQKLDVILSRLGSEDTV